MKISILLASLVLVLTNAFGSHENFVDKSKQDNYGLKMSTFDPVMEQIKQVTKIKPKSAPPSEESALQRIAEILDVPMELLVMENGKACLVDVTQAIVPFKNVIKRHPLSLYTPIME